MQMLEFTKNESSNFKPLTPQAILQASQRTERRQKTLLGTQGASSEAKLVVYGSRLRVGLERLQNKNLRPDTAGSPPQPIHNKMRSGFCLVGVNFHRWEFYDLLRKETSASPPKCQSDGKSMKRTYESGRKSMKGKCRSDRKSMKG